MAGNNTLNIGVLALQGAFQQHARMLTEMGEPSPHQVRQPQDLEGLDGLIMPGGESTTISKLLRFTELDAVLEDRLAEGLAVMSTCAGTILLSTCAGAMDMAREASGESDDLRLFGALDISVQRNAYGSQIDSFEAELDIPALAQPPFPEKSSTKFPGVFIRSPIIERVGNDTEVLAHHNDNPIIFRKNNILGITFHPELTDDTRIHELWLHQIRSS